MHCIGRVEHGDAGGHLKTGDDRGASGDPHAGNGSSGVAPETLLNDLLASQDTKVPQ